jgi:hypothetical protein
LNAIMISVDIFIAFSDRIRKRKHFLRERTCKKVGFFPLLVRILRFSIPFSEKEYNFPC